MSVPSDAVDDLLASQIAYYRAHAPKYDDWWLQEGDHDLGEGSRVRWEAEISTVSVALAAFAPLGDVLELAGGTGNWTVELARLSDSVTVVDTAPETVTIAQEKVTSDNVRWLIEDIFAYRPERHFDTVFFSFWLSHVPDDRFEQFWGLVADCLGPDGRVFFIDNAHPSLANDLPEMEPWRRQSTETVLAGITGTTDLTTGIATRMAADGSTYDLVKIWRTPEELEVSLSALGWSVQVATTGRQFIHGQGIRAHNG